MGILDQSARQSRSQLRATSRTTVTPVAHKPKVIATPKPQMPQIEPSSLVPGMKTAGRAEYARQLNMIKTMAEQGDVGAQNVLKKITEAAKSGADYQTRVKITKMVDDAASQLRRPILKIPHQAKMQKIYNELTHRPPMSTGGKWALGVGMGALALGLGAKIYGDMKKTSAFREGVKSGLKKKKAARGAVDDMGDPQQTWQGSRAKRYRPGPENEPMAGGRRSRDF